MDLTERKTETERPTLEEHVQTVVTLSTNRRLVKLCLSAVYKDGLTAKEVQELYDLIHQLHQEKARSSESLTENERTSLVVVKQELSERGADENNKL